MMRIVLLVCLVLTPCVTAQEIQVDPAAPSAGDPLRLQTTVVGNVSWDFGDGHTATGRTVSHTFPYAGIYHVAVFQGTTAAAEADVVVKIPDELYLGAAPTPTNTSAPPAPSNHTYAPRAPPGGFLHYLTENPLVLMLLLAAVLGSAMAAIVFVRKNRAKGETYEEEDKPAPAPPAKPDDAALEDLLPGVEPLPDPDESDPEPPAEETKEAEADPLSLGENEAAEPKKPEFDRDALFKKLGGTP